MHGNQPDQRSGNDQQMMMGQPTNLEKEMHGMLPVKLKNITFSGPGFTSLAENILKV